MKNAVVSPAAATPKLIDICCMVLAMELALLVLSSVDIGINQGIHAGVLQRREGAIAERLQHDDPERRAGPDGREQHQEEAEDDRVRDQHAADSRRGPEFSA